jgi:hypothetical protein
MGTFSPTHWFIVLVMITPLMALLVVPTWRILQRAGFNGAWALLMLVPVVGLLVSDAAELLQHSDKGGGGSRCYPKPRSIRESHPQLGELLRISIPAFGCFGGRIHSRLDGLGALGCYSLDQPLLVGGVCLRPFVSGDQLGMGNVLIHRGFPLAKVPFSAHFPGPPRTGKATR